MQAFEIVYNHDEDRVALGWPGGRVHVCAVEADGSPGDELVEVVHHKATIVCLAWVDDRLISVSVDGRWATSDPQTGEIVASGSVGGEYVAGSASPGGESLFLFSYVGGDSVAFRVDLSTGEQVRGPDVGDDLSVISRVFAIDADRALYHFIEEDHDTDEVIEGFVAVDFAASTATKKSFAIGPASDFDSETRMLAIDPRRGLGIRPDYQPVEIVELADDEGGGRRAVLRAEIFELETLATRSRPIVLRWPVEHLGDTAAPLATAEPDSDDFVDAQDWYVRWLCSARFVAGSEHVWVSVQHGIVRRLSLDGGESSAPIIHGGAPAGGGFTLDDVFARNLINNYTLGVSPSGRYVGFGNPNEFFCIDDVDLGAERGIKLPERAAAGAATTEAPGRIDFCGSRLVVFDRAHRMFVTDGATGEPETTVELPPMYGDATCAAASPDGSQIAVSVSGGEPFVYDVEAGEPSGLPVPPHSICAAFTSNTRLYMAHHAGAVVAVDFGLQRIEAYRANDEGYPAEMLEGMDDDELAYMRAMSVFEQRWDCFDAVVFRRGDSDHVGVIDDQGELQLYAIDADLNISDGPTIDVVGRRLAAGDGWIAVANEDTVELVDLDDKAVVKTQRFEGDLRGLYAGPDSGALYVFDNQAGTLFRIADPRGDDREALFEYRGASVGQVAISEPLGRAAVVTAAGVIELRELDGGRLVATLSVEPRGGDVRELVRSEPD